MSSTTQLFVHLGGNVGVLGEQQRKALITDLFSEFSTVHSISIPTNRETGQLQSYCFVVVDEGS